MRSWFLRIHTWCGIALAIYAVVIGVTGSLLVWQEDLEALEYPEFHSGPIPQISTGPEAALATVRQTIPEGRPISVTWPNQDTPYWMSYVLLPVGAREVYVDPASGNVRGIRDTQGGWIGVLTRAHTNLLAGSPGRRINTYAACLILVLCLTGSVLWWPGTRNLGARFRLVWTAWQLHHLTGAVSLIFIALLAVTGTYFYWSTAYIKAVSAIFARTAEPRIAPPPPGASLLGMDALAAAAQASFPGLPIHRISVVDQTTYAVRATMRDGQPEEFHLVSTAFLHPVTGEVLLRNGLSNRPSGDSILTWFSALHFGVFGGWPVKVLWTILGLSFPALAISGCHMWWRRVVQPLRRQRNQQHVAA